MQTGLDRAIAVVERLVVWLAAGGALIVLIQMVWISYGVFTRYALNAPDRMVTEATALLLTPSRHWDRNVLGLAVHSDMKRFTAHRQAAENGAPRG